MLSIERVVSGVVNFSLTVSLVCKMGGAHFARWFGLGEITVIGQTGKNISMPVHSSAKTPSLCPLAI